VILLRDIEHSVLVKYIYSMQQCDKIGESGTIDIMPFYL